MATTGVFNGTLMGVYVDGVEVAVATSFDLTVNAAEIDISSKDSAGWKDILAGQMDWSVSVDGLFSLSATEGMKEQFDELISRASVNLKMSTNVSGDYYFHGTAYCTSISMNAPKEDKPTWSATFVGSGALTKSQKT